MSIAVAYSKIGRIKQALDTTHINDIKAAVRRQVERSFLFASISPGATVAITARSRGNTYIAEITVALVEGVKKRKGAPFIGPARGSHGSAIGVSLADFVTKRRTAKIDSSATSIDPVTGVTPEKGGIPIVCEHNKEALDHALATPGPPEPGKRETLEIVGDPRQLRFDQDGNLVAGR